MATSREEINLIVKAIAEGFSNVTGDMKGLGKSFGDMSLKQELLNQKSQAYQKHVKSLAAGVRAGNISMQDAQHSANRLAGELGLTSEKTASLSTRYTELMSKLNLVKAGFEVAARVARQAYEIISEGAELNAASARFDNLATSIGSTSSALLIDMRNATSGMMSDAELIAGASDIINTGLASNHEQTVRLATAVGTLGLDMQQVILTFANNSKARLDSLGLSVSDVEERTQKFIAAGMEANEAFDTAVLEGLEAKMELLGDASETTAGQLAMLESSWENLVNEMKQGTAEAVAPAINEMSRTHSEVDKLSHLLDMGLISAREWDLAVNNIARSGISAAEAVSEFGISIDEAGNLIIDQHNVNQGQISDYKAIAAAGGEAATVMGKDMVTAADMYAAAAQKSNQVTFGTKQAIIEARLETERFFETFGDLRFEVDNFTGTGALFNEALRDTENALFALNKETLYSGGLNKDQTRVLGDLRSEYEKAQNTIVDLQIGTKGLGLSAEEQAEAVQKQRDRIAELDAAMQPLIENQAEVIGQTSAITFNAEAMNERIIASAEAAGASSSAMAILKLSLGEVSEEQAEVAIKGALLEEFINRQIEGWDGSASSIGGVLAEIENFKTAVANMPDTHNFTLQLNTVGTLPSLPGVAGGEVGVQTGTAVNRQHGGHVAAGRPYIVGEVGPELFVPNTSGQVVPNNQLGGGGGINVTIEKITVGAGASPQMVTQSVAAGVADALGRLS